MAGVAVLLEIYEIECFYCGEEFWICVPEYRNQRYCPGRDCAELGYAALTRERGRAYQQGEDGRENHAARQQVLREKATGAGESHPAGTGRAA